jgi:WD40 repeat protein
VLTPFRICCDRQVWDIRKPNAFERRFTAHEGLVMTICWHPEEKSIIASGGRDRLIKVLALAMHTDRHATWKQLQSILISCTTSICDNTDMGPESASLQPKTHNSNDRLGRAAAVAAQLSNAHRLHRVLSRLPDPRLVHQPSNYSSNRCSLHSTPELR